MALDLADADRGAGLEDRLLKIEAQVQTLSEIVARITDAEGTWPQRASQ